jgi:hypothetical protein
MGPGVERYARGTREPEAASSVVQERQFVRTAESNVERPRVHVSSLCGRDDLAGSCVSARAVVRGVDPCLDREILGEREIRRRGSGQSAISCRRHGHAAASEFRVCRRYRRVSVRGERLSAVAALRKKGARVRPVHMQRQYRERVVRIRGGRVREFSRGRREIRRVARHSLRDPEVVYVAEHGHAVRFPEVADIKRVHEIVEISGRGSRGDPDPVHVDRCHSGRPDERDVVPGVIGDGARAARRLTGSSRLRNVEVDGSARIDVAQNLLIGSSSIIYAKEVCYPGADIREIKPSIDCDIAGARTESRGIRGG